jgi:hypothetical protein
MECRFAGKCISHGDLCEHCDPYASCFYLTLFPILFFRTSLNQTISIHLFNVVIAVDRVSITPSTTAHAFAPDDIPFEKFVPSVEEQDQLKRELTFIVATSVISNIDQLSDLLENIYPKHLAHKYSEHAGKKTEQVPVYLCALTN